MTAIKTGIKIFKQLNAIMTKKQKLTSFFVCIIIIVAAFFEMLGVSAIIPFIESITNPDTFQNKKYVILIKKQLPINNNTELIIYVGCSIILIYLVKNIFLAFNSYICARFRFGLKKNLSYRLMVNYIERPYTFFLDTNSSQLMHGIDHDVRGVCCIIEELTLLIKESFALLFIGGLILYTDFFMAIGLLMISGTSLLITTFGLKRKLSLLGKKQRNAEIALSKESYQIIHGIKEIIVYQRRNVFLKHIDTVSESLRKASIENAYISSLPERIIETACIGSIIGTVCLKIYIGVDTSTFITQLGVFAMSAFRILPSVSRISGYINQIIFNRINLETIYDYLKDNSHSYKNIIEQDTKILPLKGTLSLDNINWRYANTATDIIHQLNLDIDEMDAVAFVGKSGVGKTTLIDIILGLLMPQSGTVLMNGQNVYLNQSAWAKTVGYVPQVPFFLDNTVRSNVAFGIDEKEIDDEQIWNVLEEAQIKDFVEKLPGKLNAEIGEQGIKLSGGQRQRLAIARALYHAPSILILDEATSALDNETEEAVMNAIENLKGKKTLIIIAHRLSTIQNCEKIYEIKNGIAILTQNNSQIHRK